MPPTTAPHLMNTHRLIPSRYPTVGILDAVASVEDLETIFELEGWTKDRVSAELGILPIVPQSEWVTGRPMSTIIMAAFCHPRQEGSRFNGPTRGAWYAGFSLETAHAETIFNRTKELAEIGVFETRVQMRLYLANFHAVFHDVRARVPENEAYQDPNSYAASQALARELMDAGSNGVLYRSVRHEGGECVACFRPKLVKNVRASKHFEYRWNGTPVPTIHTLPR